MQVLYFPITCYSVSVRVRNVVVQGGDEVYAEIVDEKNKRFNNKKFTGPVC